MDRVAHWNGVYTSKGERDVSWFEAEPTVSLELLDEIGLDVGTCLLDVGGGDSRLVDALIARGLRCITVLDVSEAALARRASCTPVRRAVSGPSATRRHCP